MELNNINILIISPQLYPCITGGYEIFNYYLIKELAKKGHNIWVISGCINDWHDDNIWPIVIPKKSILPITLSTFFQILLRLRKIHKKVDVVHIPYTSNSKLIYSILFAKKIYNIKYVVTIHGGGMHEWKRKKLQKSFFLNADKIVAVSQTIKGEYEKRTKRNIQVIPPLIPFRKSTLSKTDLRKKYGFENKDKIILSLGSIKRIKGSDLLLDAFFKLGLDYIKKNNLKLLYVGDGVMKDSLVEKVKDKSFCEYVKFFGIIDYEKAPDIYDLVDIYVIPSLFEGTPKSLLQAMYNALPIIGSNSCGIKNIVTNEKNGLLFEKENSDDLKRKLIVLIENKQLCRGLGQKAKDNYEGLFNYFDTIDSYLKIYHEILVET